MEALTGYHAKFIEISCEIIEHGWGKCILKAESLKDETVKVEIQSGKHYVFFIKKKDFADRENIL